MIIKTNRGAHEKTNTLIRETEKSGLQLASPSYVPYFSLWRVPKKAFGINILTAEHFNETMGETKGIMGIPFGNFIRYTPNFSRYDEINVATRIRTAFNEVAIEY
jgi:hypothetical protein